MRALYVVNPQATTTTRRIRDTIAAALHRRLEVDLRQTRYRGHARVLAREACEAGYDLVISLGGDGTVNELANGIIESGAAAPPALAPLPGGSANVFARSLGLPPEPLRATTAVLRLLRTRAPRTVAVGRVHDGARSRYFTFSAGFGWDAAVVREMERQRSDGRRAGPGRYALVAATQLVTDAALGTPRYSLHAPGGDTVGELYLTLITNTSPWTYAGRLPIRPTPRCRVEGGLDLFALTRFDPLTLARTLASMAGPRGAPPEGAGHFTRHDLSRFTIRAHEPSPCQVDGDYLGRRKQLDFESIPNALHVVG